MNTQDVQTLTPIEAQAELKELLQARPDAPWDSQESLLWRARTALLELWLVLHPVPNQTQSAACHPTPTRLHGSRQKLELPRVRLRSGVIA